MRERERRRESEYEREREESFLRRMEKQWECPNP